MSFDKNPLVSVIIPCYNHGKFLKDAIDSALNQTYSNIEVIVIDDGSTDSTADVARSYKSRILFVQQENSGLSASRNKGIQVSKGDFLAFLDADDRMDRNLIEERIQPMLRDPLIGMSAGWFRYTDELLAPWPTNIQAVPPKETRIDKWSTLHHALAHNIGLLVRRKAFDLCGTYDPLLKSCEDWDMQIRLIQKFAHAFDATPRADYRQLERSMSRNLISMYDNGLAVFIKSASYYGISIKFFYHALIGFYGHCTGAIFNRATTRELLNLFFSRPILFFVYLLFIIIRIVRRPVRTLVFLISRSIKNDKCDIV